MFLADACSQLQEGAVMVTAENGAWVMVTVDGDGESKDEASTSTGEMLN